MTILDAVDLVTPKPLPEIAIVCPYGCRVRPKYWVIPPDAPGDEWKPACGRHLVTVIALELERVSVVTVRAY